MDFKLLFLETDVPFTDGGCSSSTNISPSRALADHDLQLCLGPSTHQDPHAGIATPTRHGPDKALSQPQRAVSELTMRRRIKLQKKVELDTTWICRWASPLDDPRKAGPRRETLNKNPVVASLQGFLSLVLISRRAEETGALIIQL